MVKIPESLKRSRFLMKPRENVAIGETGRYPSSARKVRAIRASTGLSQAQFAERAKINVRSLQNWEIGRTRPSESAWAQLEKMER